MAQSGAMSSDEIFELLKKIMVREFDLAPEEIRLTSGLEDLDLDSIDAVDLAIAVEEEIGFRFTTDDMEAFETMQDVVEVIAGQRSHGDT